MEGCGDGFLCVACLDSFDYDHKGKTLSTTCEFGERLCRVVNAVCDIRVGKKPSRGKPLVKRIPLVAKKGNFDNHKVGV